MQDSVNGVWNAFYNVKSSVEDSLTTFKTFQTTCKRLTDSPWNVKFGAVKVYASPGVVRAGLHSSLVTWQVLSWSGGHEFELGWVQVGVLGISVLSLLELKISSFCLTSINLTYIYTCTCIPHWLAMYMPSVHTDYLLVVHYAGGWSVCFMESNISNRQATTTSF